MTSYKQGYREGWSGVPNKSQSYKRDEAMHVLGEIDASVKARWEKALEEQLPEVAGQPRARPYMLGRIAEVYQAFGNDGAHMGPLTENCTLKRSLQNETRVGEMITGWRAPEAVNIVEIISVAPLKPVEVMEAFDMHHCRVAMTARTSLSAKFIMHSEHTAKCIGARAISLLPFCFGPLKNMHPDSD